MHQIKGNKIHFVPSLSSRTTSTTFSSSLGLGPTTHYRHTWLSLQRKSFTVQPLRLSGLLKVCGHIFLIPNLPSSFSWPSLFPTRKTWWRVQLFIHPSIHLTSS